MSAVMIGTILSNRYKIISQLGSGGMAWVYLAEDLHQDEWVAVKVLYPQHSQDLNFLQRFGQETELAMSLSQCAPKRQIVCVLDRGSDGDSHYLVMEYVRGQDLGQVLDERGALPWPEALDIARHVAMALDHAHHYEIVHRDIKPGNVMILPDGSVRVLDFGIARARTSPHLTLDGFVGSPHYAAPEQAMGESVDTRADLYSLGVMVYRCLCGELPFQGPTPWAIVNQHISAPPPPLEQIRPGLPEPVLRLVRKAMAKRPEERFQTPAEMIQAIDQVLASHDLPSKVTASERRLPAFSVPHQDLRSQSSNRQKHQVDGHLLPSDIPTRIEKPSERTISPAPGRSDSRAETLVEGPERGTSPVSDGQQEPSDGTRSKSRPRALWAILLALSVTLSLVGRLIAHAA